MKSVVNTILWMLLAVTQVAAQVDGTLDIYLIDTEGGQATLFVTAAGESVLVDTGNPGERDLARIMATLTEAGVEQIDHLLLTHYHIDHIGGVQALAERLPILHYIDHGPSVEPREQVPGFQQAYAELRTASEHTVVQPGDRIQIAGIQWDIVASAGEVIDSPLAGAGDPNPHCSGVQPQEPTGDLENAQSIGSVITFGRFRTINLGDLLRNQELALMCPANLVGNVDVYITSHHGLDSSGSPALVHAIAPRVAVMNNGASKGGSVGAFRVLYDSPGLEDLWQLHWSIGAALDYNTAGRFIANVEEPATVAAVITADPGDRTVRRAVRHEGPAHSIKISARDDGSFTVTNTRNGFSKVYPPAMR